MNHEGHSHYCRPRRGFFLLRFLGMGILGLAFVAGVTALLMLLWNGVLVDLFHFPVLGYLQALVVLVVGRLLFGHFGGRGMHRHGGHGRWMEHGPWAGRGSYGDWWKEKGRADFEAWVKEQQAKEKT